MQLRSFLLSFALANLCMNGMEYAVTAQSKPRPAVLRGEDVMRILPGHTLLAYDETGPFWMYFPEAGTVWAQSSSGDVDVGRWWIDGDRYCRSWRVWYDGATQCWKLASYGDDYIFWLGEGNFVQGESVLQQGNAIGKTQSPLLASTASTETDPITVTGAIGPDRRIGLADASDRTSRQSGSGPSGGGSSGEGSSGGGPSGGGLSGGSSGGGSAGGGSSGGGEGGDSDGSGSGDDGGGSGGGHGHGKGGDKGGKGKH